MKKTYINPVPKEIKIDSQLIRMLTRDGFVEVFWEEFANRQREDPLSTRESVFDNLNEKYLKAFGVKRYSCYDSFRQRLNK